MKSYTDLEQSKKLTEILPIESADFVWLIGHLHTDGPRYEVIRAKDEVSEPENYWPCWSLAALFDLLPNNEHIETKVSRGGWKIDTFEYVPNTWWCEYEDTKNQTEFNISADNPVDACVKMIIKLKDLNLL